MKHSLLGWVASSIVIVACASDMGTDVPDEDPFAASAGTSAEPTGRGGAFASGGARGAEAPGGWSAASDGGAEGGRAEGSAQSGDGSVADAAVVEDGKLEGEKDGALVRAASLTLGNCNLAASFDPPGAAFMGSTVVQGVTFSQNASTAYVSSKASSASYDIYLATLNADGSLAALNTIPSFNGSNDERSPSLSADGLRLYLTKMNQNAGWSNDLAVATRLSTNEPFQPPQFLANLTSGGLNTSLHDQDPFLFGAQLYFASEHPSEIRELYVATVNGNSYSNVTALSSVNDAQEEDYRPVLSPDGLKLYFASTRPGIGGDNDGDIWVASRTATNAQFTNVTNIPALNTSNLEFPVAVSPDGCTLFFASNRDTGSSQDFRLYQARHGTSIPSIVTTSIQVIGTGSVVTAPYQCLGNCSFQGSPDTTVFVQATGQALWTGSCTSHGGNPSSDGVLVFTNGGVCTVTFQNGNPGGLGAGCVQQNQCQQGLECTNGSCQCAQDAECSTLCPCGAGEDGCESDADCGTDLFCTNGTCGPVDCRVSPLGAGCGYPGAPCGPCTAQPTCQSDVDCPSGLVCTPENGWRYGLVGQRVCEDPQCLVQAQALGCGLVTSPCGLCPPCIPNCDDAPCGGSEAELADGCGGRCTAVCAAGDPNGCESNVDCQPGEVCQQADLACQGIPCALTCRPASPCAQPDLAAPDCGTPGAVCGPSCRPPVQTMSVCVDRVCGVDPVDNISCGSCGAGSFCTTGGRCAALASDAPIQVPAGDGPNPPLRTVMPAASPAAAPMGATAGQYATSGRGTATYTIPIDVPPGRAGVAPAIALRYSSEMDAGLAGLGWSISGLSAITVCNKTYASDEYAAPPSGFEPSLDSFCLDGQRLIPYRQVGTNWELRTEVESFNKVVAVTGGDSAVYHFDVYAKDGRVLTYGGFATTALVRNDTTSSDFHTYALGKIADRSGNFIRITYDQIPAQLELSGRTGELVPAVITYTGHGTTDGDREVLFQYDVRADHMFGYRAGGIPNQRTKLLRAVEVRAQGNVVRRYELTHELVSGQNRLRSVQEAATAVACSDGGLCKPATVFEYFDDVGFEPGVEIDAQSTYGQFGNGNVRPFGMVRQWPPEEAAARTPQLVGLDPIFERRSDRLSTLHGGISVTLSQPLPGDVGEGLRMISLKTGDPVTAFLGTAIGAINALFGDEEVDTTYRGYSFSPAFEDQFPIASDYIDSSRPQHRIVVGPTDGETVRTKFGSGLFERNEWLLDVDGDGVQDKLYCYPQPGEQVPLQYKLAAAAAVPAAYHPTVPAEATTAEATGSIPAIFPNVCKCSTFPCAGQPAPTLIFDIDGDGTRNLIVHDDENQWAALVFTDGVPAWRTDFFTALAPVVSPEDHRILPMDVNGDGLRDLVALAIERFIPDLNGPSPVINVTRPSYVAINTGTGFDVRAITTAGDPASLLSPDGLLYIVDLERDGKEELIEPGPDPAPAPGVCMNIVGYDGCANAPRPWLVRRIDESTVTRQTLPDLVARLGTTGDFDGDGNLDLLAVGRNRDYLMLHRGKGRKNGLLKAATDGLGKRIEVEYENEDQGELVFDSGLPESHAVDATCRWPYRCSERPPRTLVSSHAEAHYVDQTLQIPVLLQYDGRVRYRYKGTRTDVAGHGWLSFWEREIRNEDGVGVPVGRTTIRFEPPGPWDPATSSIPYTHPTAGLPQEIVNTSAVNGSPFSIQSEAVATETLYQRTVGTSDAGRPFPVLDQLTETVRGLPDGVAPGEPLSRRMTVYSTDEFGNVESTNTTAEDLASDGNPVAGSRTTLSVERPVNPTQTELDQWLVGLPDSETVTATPRCATPLECSALRRQRRTSYTYVSGTTLPNIIERQAGDPGQSLRIVKVHDTFGNVTAAIATDEQGNVRETTTTYDSRDLFPLEVTRIGNGQQHVSQVRYDDRFGFVTASADPNGIDSTWSYDEFGLERHHRGPNGERMTTYAAEDQFSAFGTGSEALTIVAAYSVEATETEGGRVKTFYNAFGQPVQRVVMGFDSQAVFEEFVYDYRQRLAQRTRPHLEDDTSQSLIGYVYDNLNRLDREDRPDGGSTKHEYGLVRFAIVQPSFQPSFDAPGATFVKRTTVSGTNARTYTLSDRDGAVVRHLDGLGNPTDYTYTAFGLVRRVTDAAGRTLSNVYDDWGRRVSSTDAARGGTETTEYNGFDEAILSVDAANRSRSTTYDAFGRPELVTDSVDNAETRFFYDGDGTRRNEIGRAVGSESSTGQRTAFRYEPPEPTRNRGLVKQVTEYRSAPGSSAAERAFVTDYTHGPGGRLETMVYPDAFGTRHFVRYEYDGFGYLLRVEDGNDPSVAHWRYAGHDQGYRVKFERIGTTACGGSELGTLTERTYDSANGKLLGIATTCGSATLQSLTYDHDLAGRLTLRTDAVAGRSEVFRYDALNRVTHINDVEHYTYDPEGRGRLTSLRSEAGVRTYTYQPNGRDWIAGTTGAGAPVAYGQDGVGNVTARTVGTSSQIFEYTGFDLPKRVTAGASVTEFAYDAAGERAVKHTPNATTFYVGRHHQEIEQTGAPRARSYVYVGGRAVAQLETSSTGATAVRHLYDDVLGSVALVTSAAANAESSRDYAPFGEQRSSAGSATQVPFGFTGHEHDEDLGLVNMRGRWYDPLIGQFLQADPVIADPVSQGLNRYAYVSNSPLNLVDPTGRISMGDISDAASDVFDRTLGAGLEELGRIALDVGEEIVSSDAADIGLRGLEAWGLGLAGKGLSSAWSPPTTWLGIDSGSQAWLNGAMAGWRGIYSIDAEGALAFVSDSTWGINGTTLGNGVNLINTTIGASYDQGLSSRQNRQVFHYGFRIKGKYAFTQGNVVSNLRHRTGTLLEHETEHVATNRIFGPFYTASYGAWFAGMAYYLGVYDLAYAYVKFEQPDFDNVQAMAYYSNFWEQHAYCSNNPQGWSGKSGAFAYCH